MVSLRELRYSLIDVIMQTNDMRKLRHAYKELTQEDAVNPEHGMSTRDKPRTITLMHQVDLQTIRNRQDISPLSFDEISEMNQNEDWDQSLEELIASID